MIATWFLAAAVAAQAQGHSHAAMTPPPSGVPTPVEAGQSAYAALGEAVAILTADPQTDWSKVNVEALRAHLIDMDNVTLRARATTEKLPNGARFRVTGDQSTAASIKSMTRSHFTSSNIPGGWKMVVDPLADGAVVTVTSERPDQAKRIQALGFFGILTLGGHHQPHHLMIARGAHH
jgi:hypothetical protein